MYKIFTVLNVPPSPSYNIKSANALKNLWESMVMVKDSRLLVCLMKGVELRFQG